MSKINVFFPGWGIYDRNYNIADIDGSKITHLTYAFFNIVNGEVVSGDTWADFEKRNNTSLSQDDWNTPGGLYGNMYQLWKFKQKYRHVKTLIGIGGWTWSTSFSGSISTDTGRKKLAASAIKMMLAVCADGTSWDYEYPVTRNDIPNSPDDAKNYLLLLKEVRNQYNQISYKKDWLLTVASPAGANHYSVWDLKALSDVISGFDIMTYDFEGSNWSTKTGHQANLYPVTGFVNSVDTAITAYLSAGVPANKILLGYPSYARGFASTTGLGSSFSGGGSGTWEPGTYDYKKIPAGGVETYDPVAGATYSYDAAQKMFMSYDNPTSLKAKIDYAKSKKLGGVFYWEASSDFPTLNPKSLLLTAYNNLSSSLDKSPNNLYYPNNSYPNIKSDPMNIPANNNAGNVIPIPDPTPIPDPIPDPVPQPPNPTPSTGRPIIENYVESWNQKPSYQTLISSPTDVFIISFIKVVQSGSNFIVNGCDMSTAQQQQFISMAKATGKKVKIGLGGASFPLSGVINNMATIPAIAKALADYVKTIGYQGLDFDIEDSPQANLQIELVKQLRALLPFGQYLISYCPMAPVNSNTNFRTIITQSHQYLDSVNIMAYNAGKTYSYIDDSKKLIAAGVPKSKLNFGWMPLKDDMGTETTLQMVKDNCQYIKDNGFYGTFTWSLNRDFNGQMTYASGEVVKSISAIFGSSPIPNPIPDPTPQPTNIPLQSLKLNCNLNPSANTITNLTLTKNPANTTSKNITVKFRLNLNNSSVSNVNITTQ